MIALACIYTDTFKPLSDLTWNSNKELYCTKHNFAGFNKHVVYTGTKIGFEKLRLVRDILADNTVEWVWCTGTDSLITDFTNDLSSLIATDASCLITSDRNGINADSFLIKNDKEGKYIIDWSLENSDWMGSEQEAFARLIGQLPPAIISTPGIMKMLPQRSMNSYNYDMYPNPENRIDSLGTNGQWQYGDLLIHWPGYFDHPEMRIPWIQEWLGKVKYD